jgi:tetratricopeptide (TPR) repeat protein
VQSGGEVAGVLVGLSDHQLVKHLERLKALGLVFRYTTDGQVAYSAHPFLREFFRNLLGTKPESVHESVRARLAPSLEARPSKPPSDPAILDQYELLIEQTLLAGRVQQAFDLLRNGLGFENLGWVLSDNTRGLRVLERFVPMDDFSHIEPHLSLQERSGLVSSLGVFAMTLGDLSRARVAFGHCKRLDADAADQKSESDDALNLALLDLKAGHFPVALDRSGCSVALAGQAKRETANSLGSRAIARFALGDVSAAEADFQRATAVEGLPMYGLRGIWEAESKLLRGDRPGALSQTQANGELMFRFNHTIDLCLCDALLARLLLPDDPARSAQHLRHGRAFASRSGDVELQLRCFHAACELHRHLGDLPQSITEAEAGILLADTCGFGWFSIDLRLALAETLLAAGDPRRALQNARNALDRSEAPDCQYAWGKADGLHFCGIAHLRLGEHELARQRLTAALDIRERLGHGRIEETRRALDQCR